MRRCTRSRRERCGFVIYYHFSDERQKLLFYLQTSLRLNPEVNLKGVPRWGDRFGQYGIKVEIKVSPLVEGVHR